MIISRIAPTPSGFLHLGNAFSFLLTWLIVKQNNGKLVLRIDDLDINRMRTEYLDDIFFILEWLKIDYDIGASGTADFLNNFSQQSRLPLYEKLLDGLLEKNLVYACVCSRTQISASAAGGLYEGTCRKKNLDLDYPESKWRVLVEEATKMVFIDEKRGETTIDLAAAMPDFVVRKRDKSPAYQIASLADDLHFGVNYIVRGEDLLDSTAAQLFLAQQTDNLRFTHSKFYHHVLLTDREGQKLSKSDGALSLREIRKRNNASAIYQVVAHELKLPNADKISTIDNLFEAFATA